MYAGQTPTPMRVAYKQANPPHCRGVYGKATGSNNNWTAMEVFVYLSGVWILSTSFGLSTGQLGTVQTLGPHVHPIIDFSLSSITSPPFWGGRALLILFSEIILDLFQIHLDSKGDGAIWVRASVLWSSLPENHRLAESANPFKTMLLQHIYCFYMPCFIWSVVLCFICWFVLLCVSAYSVSDRVVCVLFSYYILILHIYSILILMNSFIF